VTHLTVREWDHVPIGEGSGRFTRVQANALHKSACAHPQARNDGTNILGFGRDRLIARQMVGVLAARGCSLEILPKIEPEASEESDVAAIRSRLVHMLDVALDLGLSEGGAAPLARQSETLLDILVRLFATRLLDEARRGLPRRYLACEDDLSALRGRLNVTRQFKINAVRPDRLACRFDELSPDTPLLQLMKAAVVFLEKHARSHETRRQLVELRHLLSDVTDIPTRALPWDRVQLDRSNRRWRSLLALAKLFLKKDWQATHHDALAGDGITLLFPMNDLFEAYVAALMRRALSPHGIEVVAQGGFARCLGEWVEGEDCRGAMFQTRPDIILRRNGRDLAIIDTKWKQLATGEAKHGVSQADVYQMMAYARLYSCRELMLLYPATPGASESPRQAFGIHGGRERLRIATIDVAHDKVVIESALGELALAMLPNNQLFAACTPEPALF